MISVIVPVGPNPKYREYLPGCLQSIVEQMETGDELLIVDDRADLEAEFFAPIPIPEGAHLYYAKNDWWLGCAASWNIGVGLASNENCILMGSDDKLLPKCLEACREVIQQPNYDPYGYYNLGCWVGEQNELVTAFNNAAMVSKKLWTRIKGFPVESGIGAPDALVISCLMAHASQHLHQIRDGAPLVWVRTGDHQDTRRTGGYFGEIISIRHRVTESFKWVENE